MKESMYYATYDVSNNSTRESVIYTLKNSGFTRIQKSVFCGKISNQQKKDIIEKIKMTIDENDSFYLMMACTNCFGKMSIVGKGFDKEYVSDEKDSMVI